MKKVLTSFLFILKAASQDEIRIYPRKEKLDNGFARTLKVDAQVLLVNLLADQLIVFCADSVVTIYQLAMSNNAVQGMLIGSEKCLT